MGNNKESGQKDTLEDLTGISDDKSADVKSIEGYVTKLSKEYHTDVLIKKGIVTKGDLIFIAKVNYEIDKYMHSTNAERSSAITGVFAVLGAENRVLGTSIRLKYERLLSKINSYRRIE